MKQEVRIIGGLYRGKKLPVPEIEGLRPTPDRVRETLFNWLMHDIKEAHCLDAFAGSGALGLEAFSRGASEVTFLEIAPTAHSSLQKIIKGFNSPKIKLLKADSMQFIQQSSDQFDIIFLDPPFAKNLLPTCLEELAQRACLVKGGLVYLESNSALTFDETIWEVLKLKQAGSVIYGLLRKR